MESSRAANMFCWYELVEAQKGINSVPQNHANISGLSSLTRELL